MTPWWRDEAPKNLWPAFEDFKVFLRLLWKHLKLPPPTPIQLDIADYLQNGPRRKVIMAFRGVGKSWITAGFVVWCLLRDQQENILVVSASKERADQFTIFTLGLIRDFPLLQHLYPEAHQRNSKLAFDVAGADTDQNPSVKSAGIFGQITGTRADRIIADDIEVPNTAETQVMRDKLAERVREFDAILKPLPHSEITYLGTAQTEQSLYNALPDRGYERRIWPARVPTREQVAKYGADLAPLIEKLTSERPSGSSTDPDRFSDLDLQTRELSYGRSGFALQFMLDTALSDADRYPLKVSDLIVMDCDRDSAPQKPIYAKGDTQLIKELDEFNPALRGDRFYAPFDFERDPTSGNIDRAPYTGRAMFIDPSGRGKDETSWSVQYMLNGFIFLMAQGGYQSGYSDETLMGLAITARTWKVNCIQVEENFGGGMFAALLRPVVNRIYPCVIEEVRSTGMKEARIIDTLEPVLNQHRLVVNRPVIEADYKSTQDLPIEQQNQYRLFFQMTRMVREKGALSHDDRIDVLAQGVAYWVEQMSADAGNEIVHRRQEALEAMVAKYLEGVGAQHPNPYADTWLDLPVL